MGNPQREIFLLRSVWFRDLVPEAHYLLHEILVCLVAKEENLRSLDCRFGSSQQNKDPGILIISWESDESEDHLPCEKIDRNSIERQVCSRQFQSFSVIASHPTFLVASAYTKCFHRNPASSIYNPCSLSVLLDPDIRTAPYHLLFVQSILKEFSYRYKQTKPPPTKVGGFKSVP